MYTDQKITWFDVWHLQLPVNARRDHGIGSVENVIDIVVLRLTAEGGESGFGAASPWWGWLGFRPSPTDSLLLIGEVGNSGACAAFGYHHIGLTGGPENWANGGRSNCRQARQQ